MHINEDHFLAEVIDPETLEPVPEGDAGELVFTSLTKEAFPVVRYRTRDISRLTYEPCACGRTTARMARVTGRTDDMLIIRGVNVFPSQIESVLLEVEGTEPHYQIVVERAGRPGRHRGAGGGLRGHLLRRGEEDVRPAGADRRPAEQRAGDTGGGEAGRAAHDPAQPRARRSG